MAIHVILSFFLIMGKGVLVVTPL
jgi:hypothetical protein